jgi:cytochrome c biogenesis protein CcdA
VTEFLLAGASAFWLGILTSISPCPLATNIAAVSFIGRRADGTLKAALSGLAYSLGRALAYTGLGAVVVLGLLSIPGVSNFLQRYMNKLLGPMLILVGMYLLGLLGFRLATSVGSQALRERAASSGILGAGFLGILFALSLCPVSAALFFGSLVPLAVAQDSKILLPMLYGIGTGLPVVVVAALVSGGERTLGSALNQLDKVQKWALRITGAVFIGVGIYLTIRFVFLA